MRYGKSMSCWTKSKEKLNRVKLVRLSKHKKSQYKNCQTLVRTLHDRLVPRMHYLQQSANNSSFDAFIEMGSITQPPVQKFNKRKIEETFFRSNPCFICLKTGHDAKNCFKTKRCRHCDGKSPVGLTADIERAFLMVSIKEEDRNMLRFLWFDDPGRDIPKIAQFRFNRLLFGLRPSPSILGATIAHH